MQVISIFGRLTECSPNLSCRKAYPVITRCLLTINYGCCIRKASIPLAINPRFLFSVTQHNMGPRQPKSHGPSTLNCACAQINKLSNRKSTYLNHFSRATRSGSLGWNRKTGWLAILDNITSPSIRSSVLANSQALTGHLRLSPIRRI